MFSDDLLKSLQVHLTNQTLHFIVLSRPKQGAGSSKITVRQLVNTKDVYYQLTRQCAQKAIHSNHRPQELLDIVWPLLQTEYSEAVFFTEASDFHVLISKRQKWTIMQKKPTRQTLRQTHNRLKSYVLEANEPVPFLIELGVMRKDGSIIPKMAHKYKQINRFVEIVSDIAPNLMPDKALNVVDFGCGKSYLTFALYHYFRHILKRDINIIGLDLKADVIAHCQQLVQTFGYSGLHFQVGDINNHQPAGKIDMVVSLHACDTATDAALEKAVKWQADVILCVPCCQHELYSQIQNKSLSPILKHGILRERFAALATDAARAQLLEIAGYRTQVMEFIDMEHTPKNLLIRAVRVPGKQDVSQARAAYEDFVRSLVISPFLQHLLEP